MTIKELFLSRIRERAEQIRANMVSDALKDLADRKILDITPVEAAELADRHIRTYLAQELYLLTSKTLAE